MKVLLSAMTLMVALAYGSVASAESSHNSAQDNTEHSQHTEPASAKLFPQPKPDPENAKQPGKPELVEPAYFASVSGSTTLKWKEVADATNYHVQVATDPNFKWLTVDEHMYKGTSFELKNLEAGKHYYWRVAATNQLKWAGSTKSYYAKSMFETK